MVLSHTTVITEVYKIGSLTLQGAPESCMPLHQRPCTEAGSRILLTGLVATLAKKYTLFKQAVGCVSSKLFCININYFADLT